MNGMAPGRMVHRRALLKQFDSFNRSLDASREGKTSTPTLPARSTSLPRPRSATP